MFSRRVLHEELHISNEEPPDGLIQAMFTMYDFTACLYFQELGCEQQYVANLAWCCTHVLFSKAASTVISSYLLYMKKVAALL